MRQHRWHEAKRVDNTLRGAPRQARKVPSTGYRQNVAVCSDADSVLHWSRYMRDLFARRLKDRDDNGLDWPEVQGAMDGPDAAFCDTLFDWSIDGVHVGRAPGHNAQWHTGGAVQILQVGSCPIAQAIEAHVGHSENPSKNYYWGWNTLP